MLATLIALAIIFLAITGILSVSATFTVIYDNKWTTTVKILWYEKEIKLSSILNFILFPDKAAQEARTKQQEKKSAEDKNAEMKPATESAEAEPEQKTNQSPKKASKPNYIKKLFDEDGVVGILLLISNMFQSASSAINTLFRGFHIYSLYVKMIIGGGDAADIAEKYGQICSYYYPVKGLILNGMKVDEYDEVFFADFIAPRSEYELQLIGSISLRLLLRIGFSAVKTFLINMIQNNKNSK
ncbi:MAG: hypothetical protein J1E05_02915 [Eubacterium sp.]|nr:hypothetical protein [Eubacterium sp.]